MEVRVLGKSPSWQDDGGACSGYLVQEDGFSLLLDCGSGVFAKLRTVCDYMDVDAVLVTHLHADHFLDLFPFASALSYSPRLNGRPRSRPRLHVPPDSRAFFRRVLSCWGQEDLLEKAFSMEEYHPAEQLEIGPLSARFCEVPHFTATFACELSSAGQRFTFGADCAPSDALVAFARDTDLLMLEATLVEPEPEGEPRGHMTAAEAGALGRRAGARRVVLTHYSDELDAVRLAAEGARGFGGDVELAAERRAFQV